VIDAAYLEPDEGGWVLVLEDDFGTHSFRVDPEMVETALQPWRDHVLEGELVRREFEASGRMSWESYKESQARTEPDLWDEMRAGADHMRKYAKESDGA
jgi:hypothetical protein